MSEGCKYCETDNKFSDSGIPIMSEKQIDIRIVKQSIINAKFFLVYSIYEELDNIMGLFSNSPSYGNSKQINYCPMCGRKLGE